MVGLPVEEPKIMLLCPLHITTFVYIHLRAANLEPTYIFVILSITVMALENSAFVWIAFSRSDLSSTKDCMVWYGMDSLNVRCTFIDKLAVLQCEPQLSCSVGPKKGRATATKHNPCSCGRRNFSCLRCKHAACEVRSCSKCTSHNVKN